jgi:hypothetical protein
VDPPRDAPVADRGSDAATDGGIDPEVTSFLACDCRLGGRSARGPAFGFGLVLSIILTTATRSSTVGARAARGARTRADARERR